MVVAALRLDGLGAPAVQRADRQYDLSRLRRSILVPTLRAGDVVVLDKLTVHKQPAARSSTSSSHESPIPRPGG
jgi:hypothetical protein